MRSRLLSSLLVVGFALAGCATTDHAPDLDIAGKQSDTADYDQFQVKLALKEGKTYMQFMRDEVYKAAIDKPSMLKPVMDVEHQVGDFNFDDWQPALIKKGLGVAIRIDSKNYFFNVGYMHDLDNQKMVPARTTKAGKSIPAHMQVEDDVKSGRSYGVGPEGKQSDPSYPEYFHELAPLMGSDDAKVLAFYNAIIGAVVNCDSSGWSAKALSVDGQTVATDYLAIYTAEQLRHMMEMDQGHAMSHPWDIDMTTATYLAAFTVKTGKMVKGTAWDKGAPIDWDVKNANSGRSGVGFTRGARQNQAATIAKYEMASNKGKVLINKIKTFLPGGKADNDDVITAVFNMFGGQRAPARIDHADELIKDLVDFQAQILEDADQIVKQPVVVVAQDGFHGGGGFGGKSKGKKKASDN